MTHWFAAAGWIVVGIVLGAAVPVASAVRKFRGKLGTHGDRTLISSLILAHFRPTSLADITISERKFPFRVRADLQRTIDRLFSADTSIVHFCGLKKEYSHEGIDLSGCLVDNPHNPAVSVPPQYEEVDVGDEEPVRCLKNGLWILRQGETKFVVLLAPVANFHQVTGIQFQVATLNNSEGTRITREFFKHLEESVLKAESYRGKILSLEPAEHAYSGQASGIKVHKLRTVERDQVILPRKTLDLLDRNVVQFVKQRARLSQFRLATKRGSSFTVHPVPARRTRSTTSRSACKAIQRSW